AQWRAPPPPTPPPMEGERGWAPRRAGAPWLGSPRAPRGGPGPVGAPAPRSEGLAGERCSQLEACCEIAGLRPPREIVFPPILPPRTALIRSSSAWAREITAASTFLGSARPSPPLPSRRP